MSVWSCIGQRKTRSNASLCLVFLLQLGWLEGAEVVPLRRNRDERCMMFWHPMKTGGTTFCLLAKENEFSESFLYNFSLTKYSWSGINCKIPKLEARAYSMDSEMITSLASQADQKDGYFRFMAPISKPGMDRMKEFYGRSMVAFEPAYPVDRNWEKASFHGILTNEEMWENYYHVMTVRDPLERIMSHLLFSPTWRACASSTLSEMVTAVMARECTSICVRAICIRLRGVIKNFYKKHLSRSPYKIEEAMYNLLYRIDLVVAPTEEPEATIALATNILGWRNISTSEIPTSRMKPRSETYEAMYPDIYAILKQKVQEESEQELVDVAMEKSRLICETIQNCKWYGSEDETVNKRRSESYMKWKTFYESKEGI